MITLFSSNQTQTLGEVKDRMRTQLSGLARMVSQIGSLNKVLRFEYRIEPIDILSWLHNQTLAQKIYFSARDQKQHIAGVGCADEVSSTERPEEFIETLQDRLSPDNPRLKYYGGFSFSAESVDALWQSFGPSRFVVPQFEMSQHNGIFYFACHIHLQHIQDHFVSGLIKNLDALCFSDRTEYRKVPEIIHREDVPFREQWGEMVEQVLEREGVKTVLARRTQFQFDLKLRPHALIKFLQDLTPGCFHFCIQMDEQTGFLGATPELLCRIKDRVLYSEAIAGTAAEQEDLINPKFSLEHQYVVSMLKETFQELCADFDYDREPHTLILKEACHLKSAFQGLLKSDQTMTDVLLALHPTPAVCGVPRELSQKYITDLEPFSRGWYAAPVGMVGYDTCEFMVAIRSGLVHDGDLYLYAGAGIVEGSQPHDEWNEIEQKISRFMKVFE